MSSYKPHLSFSNKNSTNVAFPKSEIYETKTHALNRMEMGSVPSNRTSLETQNQTSFNNKYPAFERGAKSTTFPGTTALNSPMHRNDFSSLAGSSQLNTQAEKTATQQILQGSFSNTRLSDINTTKDLDEPASPRDPILGTPQTPAAVHNPQSALSPRMSSPNNLGRFAPSLLVPLGGSPLSGLGGKNPSMASPAAPPTPLKENSAEKSSSEMMALSSEIYVAVRIRPGGSSGSPGPSFCPSSARVPGRGKGCREVLKRGSISFRDVRLPGLDAAFYQMPSPKPFLTPLVAENVVECVGLGRSDPDRHFGEIEQGVIPSKSASIVRFTYHTVFDEKSTQTDIMHAIGEKAVDRVLEGYHGTVLGYGQSGSGKTYSLIGPQGGKLYTHDLSQILKPNSAHPFTFESVKDGENKPDERDYEFVESVGMLPRMLFRLFQGLEATTPMNDKDNGNDREGTSWSVFLNAVELYNEELHDLIPHTISTNNYTRHSRGERTPKTPPKAGREDVNAGFVLAQANHCENRTKNEKTTPRSSSLGALGSPFAGEISTRQSPQPTRVSLYGNSSLVSSPPSHDSDRQRVDSTVGVKTKRKKEKNEKGGGERDFSRSEMIYVQRGCTPQREDTPAADLLTHSFHFNSSHSTPSTFTSPRPSLSRSLRSNPNRKPILTNSMKTNRNFGLQSPSPLRIRDLVSKGNGSSHRGKQPSTPISTPCLSIAIEGLRTHPVRNFEEAMAVVFRALLERKMAYTRLNINSNRAHTLFFIHVVRKNPSGAGVKHAILTLVDLAGSERVSQTGAEGIRLREARKINLSLLLLGNVIRCLSQQQQHRPHLSSSRQSSLSQLEYIPYRSSNLTRLLKDSFGGNAITFLLCTISPDPADRPESLSTLHFASLARHIRNRPVLNTTQGQGAAEEVAEENERLRAQLKEAQEYIAWLKARANSSLEHHGWNQLDLTHPKLIFSPAVNSIDNSIEPCPERISHPESQAASDNLERDSCAMNLLHFMDKAASYEGIHNKEFEKGEMKMAEKVDYPMQGVLPTLGGIGADRLVGKIKECTCSCLENGAGRSLSFFSPQRVNSAGFIKEEVVTNEDLEKEADGEDTMAHTEQTKISSEDILGIPNNTLPTAFIVQNVYGVLRFIRSLYFFVERIPSITRASTKTINAQNRCELNEKTLSKPSSLRCNISMPIHRYVISSIARYFEASNYSSKPQGSKIICDNNNNNSSPHASADDYLVSALNQCFELKLLGYMDADRPVWGNYPTSSFIQSDFKGIILGHKQDQRMWVKQLFHGLQLAAAITTNGREIMPL
ncbi:unnamed protein product [Phytomonas sp. Hart1]|nr:unnamed protein product [Phytomonas sp. Hart1]|eukprot:CCW69083.1 unnamed protein product [Phytomonas sp. isolate Hart1]